MAARQEENIKLSLHEMGKGVGSSTNTDKDKQHKYYSSHFICPIEYTNTPPEPLLDCKFLPCGKLLKEYACEPATYTEKEVTHQHKPKGLHTIFDIDMVRQGIYKNKSCRSISTLKKDARLLSGVEDIDVTKRCSAKHVSVLEKQAKPEQEHPAQPLHSECTAPASKSVDPLSREEQIRMINETFSEVKKTLKHHPRKPVGTARPVSIMPILPDMELQKFEFTHFKFDLTPGNNSDCILKDFGSVMINFNQQNELSKRYFLSGHRFKEEPGPECSANPEDRFLFREHDGKMLYTPCERYIKMRRERPKANVAVDQMHLEVKYVPLKKKQRTAIPLYLQ